MTRLAPGHGTATAANTTLICFLFLNYFPSIKQEPQIVLAFIKKKQWSQRQAENPTHMADDSLS